MNLRTFAFWGMIILVVALSIYVLYWTKTEGFACLNDSYGYAIKLLEEENQGQVNCYCSVNGASVVWNSTGFSNRERT